MIDIYFPVCVHKINILRNFISLQTTYGFWLWNS